MNEKRIDYNSPAELKAYLEQNGLAMQKKFGQNFLVNGKARATLADSLAVQPGMRVWEVGPGLGAMTSELLKRGAVLTVFEIDRGFIDALKTLFSEYEASGALRIVAGDVLKNWKSEAESHGLPDRFFGNLPYNIAASLIGDTIEAHCRFERAVFTVQKEVAERMCAAVGTADYSSFSVPVGIPRQAGHRPCRREFLAEAECRIAGGCAGTCGRLPALRKSCIVCVHAASIVCRPPQNGQK